MVILLLASGGFEWVRSRLLIAANFRLEKNLRDSVSRSASQYTLVTGNPGMAGQAMTDLLHLRQFITGNGIFAFMDALWTLVYIWIMYMFHPLFGVGAIIAAIVMLGLALATQKATSERLLTANALTQSAQSSYQASLRNSEVIQGMGMGSNINMANGILYDKASNEQAVASTIAGRLAAISRSFRLVSQSLLLGIGAYLAVDGQISPGLMIAGSLLLGRALAPIDLMVATWSPFIEAKNQLNRLRNLLISFPDDIDRMSLPAPTGQLSVENITVIPPGSQMAAVRGVAFQIGAGESLGIVGPSRPLYYDS